MPIITLHTSIHAPIKIVFDLSCSIDLHKISTAHTNEKAVAGKTSGLIGLNESVTWEAKHFGIVQRLTTKITEFDSPRYFADEMVQGAFKRFKHEHHFVEEGDVIVMKDIFDYTSPLGILGKLADVIILKRYMTDLLVKRNLIIKEFAESDKWKEVLNA